MMMTIHSPWMVCRRRNSRAVLRLFCFPYAGAAASIFRDWADDLPETIEVWSIQYPGRENRIKEPLFTQLQPLARVIRHELSLNQIPFTFFGHSVGAIISFEVTRELRRTNQALPLRLFLSGSSAPHVPDLGPPIHTLPEPDFLEKLRTYNGTPKEVLERPELRELFIPALRADFALRETHAYQPESALRCPISVFGGVDDPEVSREHLEAWREQTSGAFQLLMLPGDHFFIHTSRHALLQMLSLELTQCAQTVMSMADWTPTLEVSS